MCSFRSCTAPDLVQRLKCDKPAQAVAKKGKTLPRVKVRQDRFYQVADQKLEALVRFLAKAPFPSRQLDDDCFDFRAELFLPASKSGRSSPGVGDAEELDYAAISGRRVLEDRNAFLPAPRSCKAGAK
jgi:hypothetical protein